MPLRSVAVLLPERPAPFEFGVLCEVFGIDRSDDGVPPVDFRVCAREPGVPIETGFGLAVVAHHGYDAASGADVVAVPATPVRDFDPALLDAVRAAHERGATLLSVCSGVLVLAAAGVLDGRRCTCHWFNADELTRTYPRVRIDPDVLFVDDGDIITSAGTAAGIDACLHLVRRELGAHVATRIARRMVVPPQRDGGQRQFIEHPVPELRGSSLSGLLEWVDQHLALEHSVRELARRASMSERTFARRFVAETGTTPTQWLIARRLDLARRLLEQTDLGVDAIAQRAGFGSASVLRHHFSGSVGVSPHAYRRTFAAGR